MEPECRIWDAASLLCGITDASKLLPKNKTYGIKTGRSLISSRFTSLHPFCPNSREGEVQDESEEWGCLLVDVRVGMRQNECDKV